MKKKNTLNEMLNEMDKQRIEEIETDLQPYQKYINGRKVVVMATSIQDAEKQFSLLIK